MEKLTDFLAENALSSAGDPGDMASHIVIDGVILSQTDDNLTIGWMGSKFQLQKSDVVGATHCPIPIPNPFGGGLNARLFVSNDAELKSISVIKASDVVKSMPFSLRLPSETLRIDRPQFSTAELSWFSARGIQPDAPSSDPLTTSYTGTQSSQSTATRSGDGYDDNNSDDMGRDDANADDVGASLARVTTTYTGSQSSQSTATRSGDGFDDNNSDSMGTDDQNADDVAAD